MNNIHAEAVNKEADLILARLSVGRYSRLSKRDQNSFVLMAERLKHIAQDLQDDALLSNTKWYNGFKWW